MRPAELRTPVQRQRRGVPTSYALRNDGTVWAWGSNAFGQLGDGTTTTTHTPVQVSGLTNVVAIGAADATGYATKADGTVWAWGNNASGQVGDGTTIERHRPVRVTGVGFTQISGDSAVTEAIDAAGMLYRWGGRPGTTICTRPAVVTGHCPVKSLVGPGIDSHRLCTDGSIEGATVLAGVTAVSKAGRSGSLQALRADGTVDVFQGFDFGWAPVPGLSGIKVIGAADSVEGVATTGA